MRLLIQRVAQANVNVDKICTAQINKGLLVFVGIEHTDAIEDLVWAANKLLHLRIFDDEHGGMNLAINEINGEVLVVSQFTLYAQIKKGNRPSYIRSAHPEIAKPLYEKFIEIVNNNLKKTIQTGIFGADMQVALTNDGPVTIWIDTKNKE